MSRPRKPFGANHPGRLPATMMKVLAAEMSDPSRLRRGKQYAKDGSVLDIVVDPGVVTCEIQGSRSVPYIATLGVTQGDGMPLRRDVATSCTCPDDDNWEGDACKHVVATMFAFSDELLLEPELLDVWRNRESRSSTSGPAGRSDDDGHDDHDHGDDDTDDGDDTDGRRDDDDSPRAAGRRADTRRRHLRVVGADERSSSSGADTDDHTDPLVDLLGVPNGSTVPDVGALDDADPVMPRRPDLAAVYRDALAHVRVIWD